MSFLKPKNMKHNEQYFNTTCQTGEELKKYTSNAKAQSGIILELFKKHKRQMTPSEVWVNAFDVDSVPLTSIRRAINVLTSEGLLSKTIKTKTGLYGRPEYYWELPSTAGNSTNI